ncbi:MAG: hypothetical protein MMC23_006732 [Stictis urceolatum]|nr:hypothetical protein [Stictis urceolata]
MAENVAPNGAKTDAVPGVPYYEKLKRDLRETLSKKRLVDKHMAQLEEQIHRIETSYLEETPAGNIIKGFDNYIKGSSISTISGGAGGGTSTRRKGAIADQDRVFSRSSASFMKESSPTSSTQTTPSHAPTPTSSHALTSARESNQPTPTSATSMKAGASNKRQKKGADKDDEESENKPAKRLKISYSRDKGD